MNIVPRTTLSVSPETVDLYDDWLNGLSPKTKQAYASDTQLLANFLEVASARDTLAHLVGLGVAQANGAILRWRNAMVAAGHSPQSVNRRLAAARSMISLARSLGWINWELGVRNVKKGAPRRDMRGPGSNAMSRILDSVKDSPRDYLILRLLNDLALRRKEVVGLVMDDISVDLAEIRILGKGRTEKEWIKVPVKCSMALRQYLMVRGNGDGPLFPSPKNPAESLSVETVYRIVRKAADRAGVNGVVSPHRIRHSSITRALDLTNGDYRRVSQLSRHSDPRSVGIYDDSDRSVALEVAEALSDSV